jgi:hypothetical protein
MKAANLKQRCLMLCCGVVMAAAGLGPDGGVVPGDSSSSLAASSKSFSCPASTRVGSVTMTNFKATTEITSSTQCLLRCFYHGGSQPTKVLYYNLTLKSNYCVAQTGGALYY